MPAGHGERVRAPLRRRRDTQIIALAIAAASVCCASASAEAQSHWNGPAGGEGDWPDPLLWIGGVPTGSSDAYVDNGGTAVIGADGATANSVYVGQNASGRVLQMGGSFAPANEIHLGVAAGSTGRYDLSGGNLTLSQWWQDVLVGFNGAGQFTQTGGVHESGSLRLGTRQGSTGTYALSAGTLSPKEVTDVGIGGTGSFNHTGGTHNARYLFVASGEGGNGLYAMSDDAVLNVALGMSVGKVWDSSGTFLQSGGVATIDGYVHVGAWPNATGTYELSGGSLASKSLHVSHHEQNSSGPGTGVFSQTGGDNQSGLLSIGALGTYEYSGGTLTLDSGLIVKGTIDFKDSASIITVGDDSTVNLADGQVVNAGNASLHIGANSLTIVPAGFDPATAFGSFSTQGIIHYRGRELAVPAGTTMALAGTFDDPVRIEGTLRASEKEPLVLTKGLRVLNNGVFDTRNAQQQYVGAHEVRIEDVDSGIDSGAIYARTFYVGKTGTGRFTQSGGSVNGRNDFVIGHAPGSSGTYAMTGGTLSTPTLWIGGGGSGALRQSGASNVTVYNFAMGLGGGSGAYELAGDATLQVNRQPGSPYAAEASVGFSGPATFTQRGGRFAVQGALMIARQHDSRASYTLEAGSVGAEELHVGHGGVGAFVQSGGQVAAQNVRLGVAGQTQNAPFAQGKYTLSDGTIDTIGLTVGDAGKGEFVQSGGRVTTRALFLARDSSAGGEGTYTLSGGQLESRTENIGSAGPALFRHSGGVNKTEVLVVHPQGRYEHTGGALIVSRSLDARGPFSLGGAGAPSLTLEDGASAFLGTATLSDPGGISVVAGKDTFVSFPAGIDPRRDLKSFASAGLVHVAGQPLAIPAGNTVSGTGTIIGNVSNAGLLSPGNSPGDIAIQGSFTQDDAGVLRVEIANDASFDKIAVSGHAKLGGLLDLQLLGPAPAADASLKVMTFASRDGQFTRVAGWRLSPGEVLEPSYGATDVHVRKRTVTDRQWTGGSGNWNDDAAWGGAGSGPRLGDRVSIVHGDSVDRTVTHDEPLLAVNSLAIGGSGSGTTTLALAPGGNALVQTYALSIDGKAKLDLADNALIVHATPDTRDAVLAEVRDHIASARNGTVDPWAGFGITSSAAAANPLTGLIVAINPGLAQFAGQPVDENAILVRRSYNGDVNLDGRVNADDYFRIDSGFLAQPQDPLYTQGDFNYDGRVNADDYFLIDQAFLGQTGVLGVTISAVAVPEPGGMIGLLVGAASLMWRRRRWPLRLTRSAVLPR